MKQTAWAVERDAEHGREVLLLITLEADADAPRAPVAINLALDRSASMRGIPLLSAVQAAQTLVERASPRDYLGLLTFDAEPEQVLPMRAMEPGAKAQFLKVLSKLESGEGTALHEAVERAAEAAPEDLTALRALVEGLRKRGESTRLLEALERLVPRVEDADEASVLRLELASLARAEAREDAARDALEAVVSRGASGAGYADALEALEKLLGDAPGRRAEVQAG
ncbi:VWA domain-containing protein, partial [Pyxidicoccus sp. 3LFB2]